MNFIVNKITYILERPWLIVFSLVVLLGIQISNLKKEVENLKSQIDQTYNIQEVRLPSTTIVPLPSNQISIPQAQE